MPVTDLAAAVVGANLQTATDLLANAQRWLLTDGVRVLFTILVAVLARWLLHRAINRVVKTMTSKSATRIAESVAIGRVFGPTTALAQARHVQRVQTMASLLRSVATFVVASIAGLTILALVGIPLAPLLASAGVGGLAIGFGAQSLVKDFLSGVFMIFEDQYGVGDVIDTGEAIGTVEDVTLRITRLRDASGVTWYVRNGEIVRVGNTSQGFSTAIVDMPVAYDEDVERVIAVIRDAAATFGAEPAWKDKLEGEPKVLGVESISGATMTIRVRAKCVAGENFGVQRELRERLKSALDAAGIKAPPIAPFGGPVGSGGPR
ncbi:MAG: mechanosensitive ion channel family protein [Ornithinibacter sp.]